MILVINGSVNESITYMTVNSIHTTES